MAGRGYGSGQVLLLVDQSLLLVLTETGDVAFVKALPEKNVEIARFTAIDGKTWNHPVVAMANCTSVTVTRWPAFGSAH